MAKKTKKKYQYFLKATTRGTNAKTSVRLRHKTKGFAKVCLRQQSVPFSEKDLKEFFVIVPTGAKAIIQRREIHKKKSKGRNIIVLDPAEENVAVIQGPPNPDSCPEASIPDDPTPPLSDAWQWEQVSYYYDDGGPQTTVSLPDGDGDVGIRG